jgi:hypothetical protein
MGSSKTSAFGAFDSDVNARSSWIKLLTLLGWRSVTRPGIGDTAGDCRIFTLENEVLHLNKELTISIGASSSSGVNRGVAGYIKIMIIRAIGRAHNKNSLWIASIRPVN